MSETTTNSEELNKTLGIGQFTEPPNHFKRWVPWGVVILLIIIVSLFLRRQDPAENVRYHTQPARKGDLVVTVTATGTLEPTNQVEVGSELSGIIRTVDVDYNDRVKMGQVLASLDTAKLHAQVVQAKAALDSAKARVAQTEATVTETTNERDRLHRAQDLSNGKLSSQHDLDSAHAAWQRAKADLAAAKAAVAESGAALDAKETDLAKSVIYSPINGIVLVRSVEPGQTVAASLQAPVLFTLAEDLGQMELHVAVDEADVGQIKKGQTATFTVDAYPDRTFPARITQVRYGAQVVDGVVTYETVLTVDNKDLTLRPGMTATADITVDRQGQVLMVANGALRFTPPPQKTATTKRGGSLLSKLFPRRSHRKGKQQKPSKKMARQQQVWTVRDNKPVAITVTTGASDGIMTAVSGDEVSEGMELIVDMESGTK